MTVETTTTIAGPYPTNGIVTAFPFNFKALSADEVEVVIVSGGVERVVSPSLYRVALADQSGTAVFTNAPDAGANLYVRANPDFKQQVKFSNQSAFLPDSHNEANDRGALRSQVLAERVARAPILPLEAEKVAGLFPTIAPDGSWGFTAAGPGATGPANNTYTSYAALIASDPARRYAYLVGDTDNPPRPDGIYTNPTAQPGAWTRQREAPTTVKEFGAVGDGVTDDTAAIQAAANYFATVGGEWRFPQGVYKTTAPIVINGSKPQRILACGKRGVYPGPFNPASPTDLAVIMPVHSARAAISFTGSKVGDGTIEMRGIALAANESGPVPVAGFGWDTAKEFFRDFCFIDCSVHGFTSAFDLYKTGGTNIEMGLLKVIRCNVNRNVWIARTLNETQWNGFSFKDNEAGQNGYLPNQGGIAVQAHDVEITGNVMEGMRDPVRLFGSMRGVVLHSNYWEAVVGRAAVHLENIRGTYEIGPNAFLAVDTGALAHPVLLTNCGAGRSAMPYRADGVHKTMPFIPGNAAAQADNVDNPMTGSETDGWLRCDSLDAGLQFAREPEFGTIARQRVTIAAREVNPINGTVMPVEQYTTAGTGSIGLTYALTGASGDWVVVSWLMKRQPDSGVATDPYISMNVNGNGAAGSRDYVVYNFSDWWRSGEWCVITAAVRLGTAMTSLSLSLFPFGTSTAAGRTARYLRPVVYTCDTPNKIIPYVDPFIAGSAPFSPTVGTWQQGDRILNSAPTAAGQGAYVCVAGGTPGSWLYA